MALSFARRFKASAIPLYALVLAGGLCLGAIQADRRAAAFVETAIACDPFGYLLSAELMRQAIHECRWPAWHLESTQQSLAIDYLQHAHFDSERWKRVVGPHSTHYYAHAQAIGIQYPPGTGLVLSAFPEGQAVPRLNRALLLIILGVGLTFLGFAGARASLGTPRIPGHASIIRIAQMGTSTLATLYGFHVIANLDNRSFSLNALILPLGLSLLLAFASAQATRRHKRRWAWILAGLAGASFGLTILIRLPSALLGPGLFWLLESFSAGVILTGASFLTGVLPVLFYNQSVAGAWRLSTYMPDDASPPSLAHLAYRLDWYLGRGAAAGDNQFVFNLALGALGLAILTRARFGVARRFQAILLLWFIPVAYFLSHAVVTNYYLTSCNLIVVWAIALACFGLPPDSVSLPPRISTARFKLSLAVLLSLAPTLLALSEIRRHLLARDWSSPTIQAHSSPILPSVLQTDHAWVWSDGSSGTLWYYAHKASFKLTAADAELRQALMLWVKQRGDEQYLMDDESAEFPALTQLGLRLGGQWRIAGEFDGIHFFKLEWPLTPRPSER